MMNDDRFQSLNKYDKVIMLLLNKKISNDDVSAPLRELRAYFCDALPLLVAHFKKRFGLPGSCWQDIEELVFEKFRSRGRWAGCDPLSLADILAAIHKDLSSRGAASRSASTHRARSSKPSYKKSSKNGNTSHSKATPLARNSEGKRVTR